MNPLEQLLSTIEKLKSNHAFQLFDALTNQKISKGYGGKYRSQSIWEYQTDIIAKHGSVKNLLNYLKNEKQVQSLRIEFRKKNGSRAISTDIPPVTVHLGTPENTMKNNTQQAQTVQASPQPTTQPVTQPAPQTPLYPQQGLAGGMVPLGMPQYMDFVKKEERLTLTEKENKRLEKENDELRADKRKLQIDLDEAKSKCVLADERLILEKDKIESNRKDWMESPFALKLAENAPQLLEMFAPKPGNAPQAGLSGAQIEGFAEASDTNKHLATIILQSNPTDDLAINLHAIFKAVLEDPSLLPQINQFIPQPKSA
mgnify:CR=1 FL=1